MLASDNLLVSMNHARQQKQKQWTRCFNQSTVGSPAVLTYDALNDSSIISCVCGGCVFTQGSAASRKFQDSLSSARGLHRNPAKLKMFRQEKTDLGRSLSYLTENLQVFQKANRYSFRPSLPNMTRYTNVTIAPELHSSECRLFLTEKQDGIFEYGASLPREKYNLPLSTHAHSVYAHDLHPSHIDY